MRAVSQIISVVFHPIFVLPLLVLYTYFSCRHLFLFPDEGAFLGFVVYSVVSGLLLPIVAILMMRGLGLISSLEMPSKNERIGPLLVTGLFYIWLFYNYYQNESVPVPVKIIVLGATISLFIAFFLNNFGKISLHSVGIGGLVVGVVIISLKFSFGYVTIDNFGQVPILFAILGSLIIGGTVMSARLVLGAHQLSETYHGLLVGIIGQVIALNILT